MFGVALNTVLLAGAVAFSMESQASHSVIETADISDGYALSKPLEMEIFPVPTTSRCIVIMTCQYMIICLALALVRSYHEVTGTAKGNVEAALRAACQTLTYGPMLCVLFIACRMRVEFLTDGKGQPQMWVQYCMYGVTFAVLVSSLTVLCIPLVTGKPVPLKEGTGDLEQPTDEDANSSKSMFYVLSAIRYAILLGLYGGLAGVIVGINTYLPPGEDDLTKLPAPAPAVMCTMLISVLFFLTQLVVAFCRSYTEFFHVEFPTTVKVMNAAATTVEFGPMLCILFLSLRMRALQHGAQPQKWAQDAMYTATCALAATTLVAIIVPLTFSGAETKTNSKTKETTFEVPGFGWIFVVLRFVCMFGFYGGAIVVSYAVFVFEAPSGPTAPISPTVQCVMNLTAQYFFVYFMMTLMLTTSEVSGYRLEELNSFAALEASKATLAFAPMLSILFVTTRMYALQITEKKGAPQLWVQDGMYMATWALLLSFVSCLVTGWVMGEVKVDEDGNVVNKFENKLAGWFFTLLRYLTMFLLYGGICTVIYGLFVMTPETANGRGSLGAVSTALRATPFDSAPPGPGSVVHGGF